MLADILVDALSEIDLCLDEPEFLQLYSADVRNMIASLRDDMVILCAELDALDGSTVSDDISDD